MDLPAHRPSGGLSVMADRKSPRDDNAVDFFPTPPWATRALCEYVIAGFYYCVSKAPWGRTVLEPAAGQGHMVAPLAEYFQTVVASDINDYGVGYPRRDFLADEVTQEAIRNCWVITNPPFSRFAEFALRAIDIGVHCIALIGRLSVLEGQDRFRRLYSEYPPRIVAPFVERVPMAAGKVGTTTATAYCWIVWRRGWTGPTEIRWIPPCRARLTRDTDHMIGVSNATA